MSHKKITKEYCDDGSLCYKKVVSYNEYDQPILLEEWIYNKEGTTLYQKEKIAHFNCFGELKLNFKSN